MNKSEFEKMVAECEKNAIPDVLVFISETKIILSRLNSKFLLGLIKYYLSI